MKKPRWTTRGLVTVAAALALAAPLAAAGDRTHFSWSVTVGSAYPAPIYAPAPPQVVYVQPYPVYVYPTPVYVRPQPVYVIPQPAPVYGYGVGQMQYGRPQHSAGHHHWKHHHHHHYGR